MNRAARPIHLAFVVIAALAALAAAGLAANSAEPTEKADLILKNGAVYTVDVVRSWANAVAVKGETILYVGSNRGAQRYAGPKTRVVDLGGKMVLPGFQDAHVHPLWAGIESTQCDFTGLENKQAYLDTVKAYASSHPDKPWIRGNGWDMSFFPKGIPNRADLDAIVPDRPIFLYSKDGHTAWVNSKALEIAGITRDTPDPERGRIDRDRDGEPVGSLQESAIELVQEHVAPYTPDEALHGLRLALQKLNSLGITSFQEASAPLGVQDGFSMLDTYRDLDRQGELTARVVVSMLLDPEKGESQVPDLIRARREYTRGGVRAHTVKIFQDGVVESQTAGMLEPYRVRDGGHGMALVEPEELKQIVTRLDKEGFQVHFHSIGDAAIRQVLDAIEAARRANGARDSRHHLSHIEVFHPDDIPRFRELGAIANFQPLWALADGYMKDLTLPVLPPETHRWIYPIRSLLRSGAVVAFGSDWSVTSVNPLEGIEVAVRRANWTRPEEKPFMPDERIDLKDAIAAFTINAAYVNFQEKRTGSIEPGKLADLVVLNRNLFAIDPSQISETRVVLTLFGGRPVHGDLGSLGR